MIRRALFQVAVITLILLKTAIAQKTVSHDSLIFPEEKHFKSLMQLTHGGDNAEAYFSFDDKMLSLQITNPAWNVSCDQIYYTPIDSFFPKIISTGKGRTTCSYFLPGDSLVLFASTHESSFDCPPKPAPRPDHKYVWPVYSTFDIYISDLKGNIKKKLTDSPGYDAEATLSPKGDKIVFTSTRHGDLDLYTMDIDGSNVKQVTDQLGYDGGAFFSPDGTKLIFRASRPKTDEEINTYKSLLDSGQVMPVNMEIYMCNVDGSGLKQITHLGNANWAPYFSPDGTKVIFSSNHLKGGYHFNLWMCDLKGENLEQITFDPVFDAFPVFSRDGKKLVFSSNRNNGGGHDTNVFVGTWK